MDVVNRHIRKVEDAQKVQVHSIAPLAIRCALNNLVPHSLVRPKRRCIVYNQLNVFIGVVLSIKLYVYISIVVFKCDIVNIEDSVLPIVQAKGWTKKATVEFKKVVGSSALEMKIFGQDRDSFLVDLMRTPNDQCCDTLVSVRHYLVYIEVARYMD